ncbi:hypothetical protein G7K_5186-t1 [Saitoella complicata NRRL Y-17804]|uniref:Uncharacterized protein n=1 Tax=Saitoella complicata (strain BCRC 22490 / CBS 7301 / JCM 7358 / NBRC 10748 / NRRL Y-17804) TaxID=698492 RepID=A0A0E9NMK2_SAICN|nr:hypothetical protein G7K_5186-t1 [Saitoella complicata NRRL Y-17804]
MAVIELKDEDAPLLILSPDSTTSRSSFSSLRKRTTKQLLIDLALEELRHDHMVIEGVNKYSLKPDINWKACRGRSRDAPANWLLLNSSSTSKPLCNASQTQSKARKPLIPRPRHSATNSALQGISNELANDPQRYKRTLAVQTLQPKHECAKHYQQYCYVHPFFGQHRYITNDLLNLWSKYLVAKEPGVTVEDPPNHDPLFAGLLEPFKSMDQAETPESMRSLSGVPQLPTPVTASRFDLLLLPPSSQSTQAPTPTSTTIDPQMLRGSSPLQGPAAVDLDGFLAYAIIDNGVVLDDLKNIEPSGLPPVKMDGEYYAQVVAGLERYPAALYCFSIHDA